MPMVAAALIAAILTVQPAAAQVRAFAAMEYIALEPPAADAQKIHGDIAKFLRAWGNLVGSLEEVPAAKRHIFARCAVRTDVPAPAVLAFECVDAEGVYVGTKRFTSKRDWKGWLGAQVGTTHADARPLHTTRFVQVEVDRGRFADDRHGFRAYVEGRLRAAGLTVVESTGGLSADDLAHSFLKVSLRPLIFSGGGEPVDFTSGSSVVLIDGAGRTVRHFLGTTSSFFKTQGATGRGSLKAAVDRFLEEWREDAAIYDPRMRISRPGILR